MRGNHGKQNAPVNKAQKISLGLVDLGYSMVSNTMSSYIMFFGNTVMGVPGTLMGLAVAAGTMWDGLTDPFVGHMSDNVKNKLYGRRHLFILIGTLAIAIINILIWSAEKSWPALAKFFWFAIGFVLLETFNTVFATPNSALSIEISKDYNERSSIQAYKSIFAIIGLLLPTLLMGLFQQSTPEYPDGRFNPAAYLNYAYIASSAAVVFGVVMFMSTFSHIPRLRAEAEKESAGEKDKGMKDILKGFFSTLKNKNYRSVILGYSVAMMSATILVSVGFNVYTFTFKTTTTQMYIIMGGLFLMTIAGQPLWIYLAKKLDKKKAMMAGLFVSLAGSLMLFGEFLFRDFFNGLLAENPINVIFLMPPLMVAGIGTGVLYSLPLALIGDTISVEQAENTADRTGTITGFMTLAYKASRSLSQLMLGILIDVIGYREGSAVQSPAVEEALGWMLCIGVVAALSGGIALLSRYSIKREDVQTALEKISGARKEG